MGEAGRQSLDPAAANVDPRGDLEAFGQGTDPGTSLQIELRDRPHIGGQLRQSGAIPDIEATATQLQVGGQAFQRMTVRKIQKRNLQPGRQPLDRGAPGQVERPGFQAAGQ